MLPLPDSAGRREVLLLSVVRARRPKGKAAGTPDVGFAKSSRTLPPLKRARVASGDRPEPTEAAAETTKTSAWPSAGRRGIG